MCRYGKISGVEVKDTVCCLLEYFHNHVILPAIFPGSEEGQGWEYCGVADALVSHIMELR